ncbi:hypothetical protein A3749_21085, partial [Oleiphilus sp. HI0078]
ILAMSTTTITIAIVAIIFLCIGAIYISQARERARVERIRKTNVLTERHNRMQQLIHDLPPQYLNNELRIMIAERSVETLNELIILNKTERLQGYLTADHDYLKNLRENNPKFPAVPVKTEAKAKEVRGYLEVLQRFIQSQHKAKRLNAGSAKKYLDHISLSICQSKADLFCGRAEAANANGKPRVAIHNYHSAIDAFKEFAKHPQAAKAIALYKAKIKALDEVADQHNKKFREQEEAKKQEGNKEWDSFLDDEDQWQKKNSYD